MLLTGKLLEGLVAVPVGGGRARAGLEIDHSEPSGSRVAISRAGRRPPAHTAARLGEAGPVAHTAARLGEAGPVACTVRRSGEADPEVCRAAGPCGTNSSRGLVSRR